MQQRLIIWEPENWVLGCLRPKLQEKRLRWVQVRLAGECLDRLARWPRGVVLALVNEQSLIAAAEVLTSMTTRYPGARSVVVLCRGLAWAELALRELGATHIVRSPRDLSACLVIAGQHLASQPTFLTAVDRFYEVIGPLPWDVALPETQLGLSDWFR